MSGIRLLYCSKLAINWKNDNNVRTFPKFITFFWPCSVSFVKFSYWSKSGSWLVLEFWQFLFIRDWPEIRKSEIPQSEFCPISGNWGNLEIPNFGVNISSKMLLNVSKCQDYNFYHFGVFKENQLVVLNIGISYNLFW